MEKKKSIIRQFIYNVIGTTLPTLVLQLLILPLVAKDMDGDTYGFVLAMVASVMMFSSGIGNVLKNIRMLSEDEYVARKSRGDFGLLFAANACVIAFVTSGILYYYGIDDAATYFLTLLMSVLVYAKDYYIVRFWIDLDYLGILICNLVCTLGYAAGYGMFRLGGSWQLIYIAGNLASLLYTIWKYPISTPLFARTALFVSMTKRYCALTAATLLGRALQYIDRLLLYPLLGGEDATIYYVSTLIGKTLSMALGPLNSFLLSQISKKNHMSRRLFGKLMLVTAGIGFLGYWICVIAAKPLLGLLYPQWIERSMKYIYITTLTAIISAVSMVVNPMVLRFCNMNWQILINGICFAVYLIVSLLLLGRFGLMGFCVGNMLANTIALFLMVVIYLRTYKGRNIDTCVE